MWIGFIILVIIQVLLISKRSENKRTRFYKSAVILANLILFGSILSEYITGFEVYPEYIIAGLLLLGIGAVVSWKLTKLLIPAEKRQKV